MKEIWINLELYFESYEFPIFRDFLDFSEFIFEFKSFKTIKKRIKRGLFLHGTHMKVTWHARPRGRATQTHASACVARR